MESANDRYSIKNLLFTKAIPNYVIPVPAGGHKIFACTDCGDKFLLSSSYDYHVNRKSVKISYFCRHCNTVKIFYNRCNLLSHIRSHAFKTATINVSDLRLDPLPLNFINKQNLSGTAKTSSASSTIQPLKTTFTHELKSKSTAQQPRSTTIIQQTIGTTTITTQSNDSENRHILCCIECNAQLSHDGKGPSEKRAKHYMKFTNETYICPFCLFTLPTTCALSTHMRFHLKIPPYLCPECGQLLSQPQYPYDHKCEGFMMMRATVRLKCPATSCQLLHPNDYKDHVKKRHLKTVYKCSYCYVACFDEILMNNHLRTHKQEPVSTGNNKSLGSFYQCELCTGKLVLNSQADTHFKSHSPRKYVFPCWDCGKVFRDVLPLAAHHLNIHDMKNPIKKCLQQLITAIETKNAQKKVYRVVKRCDQCKRSFSYKCNFEQINMLPNECPYKCTASSGPGSAMPGKASKPENELQLLTCFICKNKMSQNWEEIKKHFNEFHKAHRCVDIRVLVSKININKYLRTKDIQKTPFKKNASRRTRKKRVQKSEANEHTQNTPGDKLVSNSTGEFVCKMCGHECDNKELLQKHLLIHKDPCMAYQCLECGQSFVVKPSFSKHLLIAHNITDFEEYIIQNQCYNESALLKYQSNTVVNEPLRENQCKVCREQFENSDDLEKHFRVHGMAFLIKNNNNKTSP